MDIRSLGNAMQSGQIFTPQSAAQPVSANAVAGAAAARQPNAPAQSKPAASTEAVTKAVDDINNAIKNFSQGLQFSVDKDSQRVIVKIVDGQTNQVIKQIPSEEALEISKSLSKLQGLLVKHEA